MMSNVSLVTGVGGPAGRAVSQYFQQHGVDVVGADMRCLDGADTKLLPPAHDDYFFSALEQVLDEERVRLLVPTVTEELPKVAEQRDLIRKRDCAVFVSDANAVRIANDKWETARALFAHGVPVPLSYCGESKEELLAAVPFPMLSKPRFGRGGRGIAIHHNSDDLPRLLSGDRVYQQFLPGEEYDVNQFADPEGVARTTVVLKKTALKGGIVGNAVRVERVHDPEVAGLAEAAVSALSMEGPIDIDIRRGNDARPFILEINARVGANVRAAEEVLVAMLASWRETQ